MADHVYKIVVNFNGGDGGDGYKSPQAESKTLSGDEQQVAQLEKIMNAPFNVLERGANSFASIVTVAAVAQTAKNIFSHEVQRVGRYTGSQQAQDVANATLSIISKIINPLGAIINSAYETDENMYQRQWESIGLQLYRERGGVSLNRSRTES